MTTAPTIGSRVVKLFKDLALALFNASVVLVVVASVLVLVLLNRVDTFSQDVAENALNAAIGAVGLSPQQTIQKLEKISVSVSELNSTLKAKKSKTASAGSVTSLGSSFTTSALSEEELKIERLTGQLKEINQALKELVSKKALFTDKVIEKVGATFSESLIRVRDCSSDYEENAAMAPSS